MRWRKPHLEETPRSAHGKSKSKDIPARLGYSVIDSDGHWREVEPIAMDYLEDAAGARSRGADEPSTFA